MISLRIHPHPDGLLGADRNPKFDNAVSWRLTLALSVLFAAAFLLLSSGSVSAQVETVLHSFDNGSVLNDGQVPGAGLIQGSDGNFYGTTENGGAHGDGTVFEITPSGSVTILHSFGSGTDGDYPEAGLIQATNGDFYGTTSRGGSAGDGTVFEITPSGTETVLHSFGDDSVANDGDFPEAGLIQVANGNLYGTTREGGSIGYGTVFEITPSGTVTILHSFDDGSVAHDGYFPVASLIQATSGNFYGTTESGGDGGDGDGTVFKMTPSGSVTILHSFDDGSVANDGEEPVAALIQATDGNFYGTTESGGDGGDGDGTVFKITSLGSVTILHSFDDGSVPNDGQEPVAALIQATDGNFYGTTEYGGSGDTDGDGGTAFKITPLGVETVLHSFGEESDPNDGYEPFGGLVQATDGNFYGTTQDGGSDSYGTVFKLTSDIVSPPVLTSISPSSAAAGSGQFTLTANGSHFVSRSVVRWNGVTLATTYGSADKLTATVPADKIATVGTASVTVFTSAPGGGTSSAKTFTIVNPVPTLSSISPTSTTIGSAGFALTVHGLRFVPKSVVRWNGVALPTTYVSATELTATVAADKVTTVGTASVTVFTSAPGGGTSTAATFTTVNPAPVLSSISPTSATAGSAGFTLRVNGAHFVLVSVVEWNGSPLSTTFVSATELTASVPASLIAKVGTASVTVFTPAFGGESPDARLHPSALGGGTSAAATFTITTPTTPSPLLTSIGPTSTPATCSAGFTLTVHGSRFVPRSVVRWKGMALPTTYVSATELKAAVPAKIIMVAGTASVTVFTSAPGGGTSAAVTFTISR